LGIERVAFLHMAFEAGATLLEDTADDFARETALLCFFLPKHVDFEFIKS
jgi:hypothetical protein